MRVLDAGVAAHDIRADHAWSGRLATSPSNHWQVVRPVPGLDRPGHHPKLGCLSVIDRNSREFPNRAARSRQSAAYGAPASVRLLPAARENSGISGPFWNFRRFSRRRREFPQARRVHTHASLLCARALRVSACSNTVFRSHVVSTAVFTRKSDANMRHMAHRSLRRPSRAGCEILRKLQEGPGSKVAPRPGREASGRSGRSIAFIPMPC
jgi:hypothetical protein